MRQFEIFEEIIDGKRFYNARCKKCGARYIAFRKRDLYDDMDVHVCEVRA